MLLNINSKLIRGCGSALSNSSSAPQIQLQNIELVSKYFSPCSSPVDHCPSKPVHLPNINLELISDEKENIDLNEKCSLLFNNSLPLNVDSQNNYRRKSVCSLANFSPTFGACTCVGEQALRTKSISCLSDRLDFNSRTTVANGWNTSCFTLSHNEPCFGFKLNTIGQSPCCGDWNHLSSSSMAVGTSSSVCSEDSVYTEKSDYYLEFSCNS